MPRALLAVLAVAGLLAGCGDDEPAPTSEATPAPTAAATETPTPTATATETPSPTATEQPSPSPEDQEGGAGDEEEARVPVRFVVRDGGVEPPKVGVPGFLALELIILNETARVRIEGRRPGRYPIDFGDAGQATLVTGVEVGP